MTRSLSEPSLRVALALFHADRADSDTSIGALANATKMSVDAIFSALEPLVDANLVAALPLPGNALRGTIDPAVLRRRIAFEMQPMLPAMLEGHLDYSPADDDERVEATVGFGLLGHVDIAVVARSLAISEARVREAIARIERRAAETGMRMRVVVELTFPDATLENFSDLITRWTESLSRNDTVRCIDAKLREAVGIDFTNDRHEYRDWRNQSGQYAPPPNSGGGLRSLTGPEESL